MAVGASGVIGGVSGDEMRRVICFEGREEVGSEVGRRAVLWVQNPSVDRHLPVSEPAVAPGLGRECLAPEPRRN